MITHTIYNQAIEVLLDRISDLNTILDQAKPEKRQAENFLKIQKARDGMVYAIDHIKELELVTEDVQSLRYQNVLLTKANRYLGSELRPYMEIRKLLLSGKHEKTLDIVKMKLESENAVK